MLYRFDDVELDPQRRELRRGGAPVAVEPQVLDLLLVLIRARDRVVSRDELLDAVWQGRLVSDATLASRISAARAAIGDSGTAQRLIRTLPRKGVRFVGVVTEDVGPVPAAPPPPTDALLPEPPAVAPPDGPSIAVLPFANLGGDPADDWLGDALADEILTALSRCAGLLVIARSSSFLYRGPVDIRRVGRELGVRSVLEGSVQRQGARLRATGQLIDAGTGGHLWAERFDGDAADPFALQDRIAAAVAAAIEPALWRAELARQRRQPPDQLDAYALLLRAQAEAEVFTAPGFDAAEACLERALALDPAYAPALAAAAYVAAQRHVQGWAAPDAARRALALARARDAVARAPDHEPVLWMAAFALWNLAPPAERDAAPALLDRALALNPHSAMALTLGGWIETMRGDAAKGRPRLELARRLSPRDPRGWLTAGALAIAAVIDGDYDAAVAWAETALAQNRRHAAALRVLAVALVKRGQRERAAAVVRELLAIEPGLTVTEFLNRIPLPLAALARTYADALRAAGLPA